MKDIMDGVMNIMTAIIYSQTLEIMFIVFKGGLFNRYKTTNVAPLIFHNERILAK